MQLTIDISLYPLREDYVDAITWFIHRLDSYPNITRKTGATATQVSGEFDVVMAMLGTEMKAAYEKWGQGVFVCKFIGGALNLDFEM